MVILFFIIWSGVASGSSVLPGLSSERGEVLYDQIGLKEIVSLPAFMNALKGIEKFGTERPEVFTLIDFTKPSTEKRFCVIDIREKRVLHSSHVAHGRNSGDNYAKSFSNKPGSNMSSLGFFRTGTTYYGKNGYSLILDGLEEGVNDKARERAIVIHGARYSDPSVIPSQGRLGRSLGCPALPLAVNKAVIDLIQGGTLLYVYGG